jgi:hypothetical protein
MNKVIVILIAVFAIMGGLTSSAHASSAYCQAVLDGVHFSPDTSTPSSVWYGYHYACPQEFVDQVVNNPSDLGCPNAFYTELQGYLPPDNVPGFNAPDCDTQAATPDFGTGNTYTELFVQRSCKDNLLIHKQHIGAGETLWNERLTGGFGYQGEFAWWFTLNGYPSNGPYYNRRCWL